MVFLEILPSAYMVGFPRAGHIYFDSITTYVRNLQINIFNIHAIGM